MAKARCQEHVTPDFRGNRIGWYLGRALRDEARTMGYRRIVLDSHISMNHAHKIYEALGFKRVAPPPVFSQELIPVVVFMECEL